jgi:hypothetical protein
VSVRAAALVLPLSIALAASSTARADPPRAELRWADQAARTELGCADAIRLEEEVEAVLGRDALDTGPGDHRAPLVLSIEVSRAERALHAELTLALRDGEVLGVRAIDQRGERCDAIEGALVVVAAMLIDLREVESRLDLRTIRAPLIPPEPSPPPTVEEVETPAPPLEPPLVAAIWAGATASYALLPGLAGAASIGGWGRPAGLWPITLTIDVFPDAGLGVVPGATFLAVIASLGVCAPFDQPDWVFRICAEASGGIVRGVGSGFADARDQIRGHADVRALFHLEVLLAAPVWLIARAGALAPLVRTQFVGDIGATRVILHQPEWVVPVGNVGIAVRIP